MEKTEIIDGYLFVTDPSFLYHDQNGDNQQFGYLFETVNMAEATGEPEFDSYPYVVSCSLMPAKVHHSFDEGDLAEPCDISRLFDAYQYAGGVPIDHTLSQDVNGGFDELCQHFTLREACIKKTTPTAGTVAAQQGKGIEFEYLQFADEDAAEKYVNLLLKDRVTAFSSLIGFILDRPINLIGDSGWKVMNYLTTGKDE